MSDEREHEQEHEHHRHQEPDVWTSSHTGPTQPATPSPPWAILALAAGLLGAATTGGFALGGLGARVVNVETRISDMSREIRDTVDKLRQSDVVMTSKMNDMQVDLASIKANQGNTLHALETLVRQHEAYPNGPPR